MSEEEKQAIAFLRRDIKFRKNNKWFENCIIEPKIAQILLNLIDKLQKENEELKVDNKKLNDLLMFSELDYVSKDKIRDKIKELEKGNKNFFIRGEKILVLKELLGE